MSLVTIDTTPLEINKKSIDVKPTGALVDLALNTQIELMQDTPNDNETILEFKMRDREVAQDIKNFIKKVLSLTSKQWEKINQTIENNTIISYGEYLCLMLQGSGFSSFQDYRDTVDAQNDEDADTDPKLLKENEES